MSTAGDLCTEIIGDLGRSDASLSDIVLIDIQSAIRDYENHRFYFNEASISLTISATNTYALSLFAAVAGGTDIIEVDGAQMTISTPGTRSYELNLLPSPEIINRQGYRWTGNPTAYCIFNENFLIDTSPNVQLTGTIQAHVKFADITTDSFATTNVWTNDAKELIRNAALKRLWGRRFRDYDAAQAAMEGERLALAALQRRTDALSGSRIDSYL